MTLVIKGVFSLLGAIPLKFCSKNLEERFCYSLDMAVYVNCDCCFTNGLRTVKLIILIIAQR